MKSIPLPLMTAYDKTKSVSERLNDYSSLGTKLLHEDIDICFEGKPYLDLAYVKGGKHWAHECPKVNPREAVVDWTAVEKAFTVLNSLDGRTSTQGYILLLLGDRRSGKSVAGRWVSDARLLQRGNKIIPAFISQEQFAEYGAFKNKCAALTNALRGIAEDPDDRNDTRCFSVLDGVCDVDLTQSETFALCAAITACVDRGEFDLIITSSATSVAEFGARLSPGRAAVGIVDRLNERYVAVEFKKSRMCKCPFLNKDGTPAEGYYSPEFDQKAAERKIKMAQYEKDQAQKNTDLREKQKREEKEEDNRRRAASAESNRIEVDRKVVACKAAEDAAAAREEEAWIEESREAAERDEADAEEEDAT